MKFQIPESSASVKNFFRVCGYKEISNPHKENEISYARPLEVGRFYPRFHIYIQNLPEEKIEINLHLDMKKPSYEGSAAHSGEYEGKLIEQEGQRVKNIAEKLVSEKTLQYRPIGFKKEKSLWKKICDLLSS